jgi:hypothetical protein
MIRLRPQFESQTTSLSGRTILIGRRVKQISPTAQSRLQLFENAVAVRDEMILHVAEGRKQLQCNGGVAAATQVREDGPEPAEPKAHQS